MRIVRTADVAPSDDLAGFVATVRTHADYFDRKLPVIIARAPGRLDVMGGIADYSGSLVLELPLAAATFVAAQACNEPEIALRSLAAHALGADDVVTLRLEALAPDGEVLDYAAAHSLLTDEPRRRWAAYVAGALVVLGRERGVRFRRGLRLLIDSTVPVGKGVASSAALEVAAMRAVCAVYDIQLDDRDLALLCQTVENRVVGAPCGVMDQMTAACGEANRLLALLCQPAQIVGQVPLPSGLELWGIDSGIRHEVGGGDYAGVRVGAFMGYRIIADVAGHAATDRGSARVDIDDPVWHGYLANVTPAEWEQTYRERVPVALDGAAFVERYGGITDRVTHIDPHRQYVVRQSTEHPIHEHQRVQWFRQLLETGAASEEVCVELGELMYASHASYGACGLGSRGTDLLVELVRAAGPAAGLYGAKITGGGSGGVVAILARSGSRAIMDDIAARYAQESGRSATVLGGSSAGRQAAVMAEVWRGD